MSLDPMKLLHGGIFVPSQEPGNQWLLVCLHGSGGSSKDFEELETIFKIPTMNYLYLNGPIRDYNGFSWYSSMESREEAFATVADALDYAASKGYASERIFLLGFSQGAALTVEFGVRYSKLLAGYISISGRIENLPGLLARGNERIIKRGRWLVTHGRNDYNLSSEVMRGQVEKMREGGFRVEFREYEKIHEFDAKYELPDIREWILQVMAD